MNCGSHDVSSRVYFQVVYIFALYSSLNTSTFCFLHVCYVPYLTCSMSDAFFQFRAKRVSAHIQIGNELILLQSNVTTTLKSVHTTFIHTQVA